MQPGQIPIRRSGIQRLLNQFDNFFYLRTLFDLKMQDTI